MACSLSYHCIDSSVFFNQDREADTYCGLVLSLKSFGTVTLLLNRLNRSKELQCVTWSMVFFKVQPTIIAFTNYLGVGVAFSFVWSASNLKIIFSVNCTLAHFFSFFAKCCYRAPNAFDKHQNLGTTKHHLSRGRVTRVLGLSLIRRHKPNCMHV